MAKRKQTIKVESTKAESTKEHILSAALELFNKNGVEAITVRHIAQQVGISHGNLCYHFARKEDIITALFETAASGISGRFLAMMAVDETALHETLTLEFLMTIIAAVYEIQQRYKFLMVDFVNIMRRLPNVQQNFQAIFPVLRAQMHRVIGVLQRKGSIRSDIPHEQFENFIRLLYIVSNFWLSEAEILYNAAENVPQETTAFFTKLAWSMLMPYLTPSGLEEYHAYFARAETERFSASVAASSQTSESSASSPT
jgi:AcrR family transcriptional regulator